MSDTIDVWYLIIDHEHAPIGDAYCLTMPGTLAVSTLKTKIKKKEQNDLAQVDERRLTIFGCTDSSINFLKDDKDAGDEGMVLNKLKKVFSDQMVEKLDVERTVASLQVMNRTLIVQVPGALHATFLCSVLNYLANTNVQQKVRKRDNDDSSDRDRSGYQHLKEVLGPATPSDLASLAKFRRVAGPRKVIDCNRPYDYDMLPIELYDKSFGSFKTRCCKPPSTYALSLLEELSIAACGWYDREITRQREVQRVLKSADLVFDAEVGPGGGRWTTDGHLDVNVMPAAIRECKNESGDALNQVILYYGKFVIEALNSPRGYRNLSTRFPCVLMVDQGPRMGFYGAVWDGRYIRVESLTNFDLTTHYQYEKGRFQIASSLDAFKETINDIQAHYEWVQDQADHAADTFQVGAPPTTTDQDLEKSFPYVTLFHIDGQDVSCTYGFCLKKDTTILFSVTSDSGNDYIVKYARRYSAETHRLFASHQLAPTLWQCQEIPGEWIVIIMDRSDYSLLSHLVLSKEEEAILQSKVTRALKTFHDQGYVHGDIRSTNILVDRASLACIDASDVKIHFVDFDFAGKIGEVKYPIGVHTKTVKRPDNVEAGVLITREHDEWMATHLFS